MNRIARHIAAALAVVTLGGAVATPASANGSISFNLAPRNAQEDHAMRTGFALYSIYNQVRNGASIRQQGNGNSAGLAQNGRGNTGLVHQRGNGHTGTLQQNGNSNAYGLFQFGRNTTSNITQNGNGTTGATIQFGW
jgi:hypothetical protein